MTETVVVLKGGVSVSLPALQLLLDLERSGFDIRLDVDASVRVGPCGELTPADRVGIAEHGDDLRVLVDYCDRALWQ